MRLPIIKSLNTVIDERFINSSFVASQGGTVVGSPVINHEIELNGTTDYVNYADILYNLHDKFTFNVEIERIDDYASRAMISSSVATGPLFWIASSSSISFFPNQSDVPVTWLGLTLTAPMTIGLTFDNIAQEAELFIDGVSQGVLSTVSYNANAGNLQFAARLGGLSFFDGNIKRFHFASAIYTSDDMLAWANGESLNYKHKRVAFYPLNDKVGASAPFTTTDLLNYTNLTLGDGSTSTTFPTKLTDQNGYSFDGGDYLLASISPYGRVSAEEMTFVAWLDLQVSDFNGVFTVIADSAQGDTSANDGFFLILDDRGSGNPTNGFTASVRANNGNARTFKSADNAIQNGIVCVGITYSSGNGLRAYINGEEVAGTLSGTGSGVFTPSSNELVFGALASTYTNKYTGKQFMYDMYYKELTANQMREIYNKGYRYLGAR